MGEPTYGRRGREVCKLGKVPISVALCQDTATADEIVAALNSNADLLAALKESTERLRLASKLLAQEELTQLATEFKRAAAMNDKVIKSAEVS